MCNLYGSQSVFPTPRGSYDFNVFEKWEISQWTKHESKGSKASHLELHTLNPGHRSVLMTGEQGDTPHDLLCDAISARGHQRSQSKFFSLFSAASVLVTCCIFDKHHPDLCEPSTLKALYVKLKYAG